MARKGTAKSGFTLLEALIAMFVVVVSVICFLPGFLCARSLTTRSQHIETATETAEAELDYWREAGYTNLPSIPNGNKSTAVSLSTANPLPGPSGNTTITYLDSTLTPSASDTGRKRVDVTVGWGAGMQDTGTVVLTTIISKGGI